MVYNNDFKVFLLSGVIFALPMGILYSALMQSIIFGMLLGIFAGAMFALLLWVFLKKVQKSSAKLREKIKPVYRIICEGPATWNGNGGWLFVTEATVEFYPHKVNFNTGAFAYWLSDIARVDTRGNTLVIFTHSSGELRFIVNRAKEWRSTLITILQRQAQNAFNNGGRL